MNVCGMHVDFGNSDSLLCASIYCQSIKLTYTKDNLQK